MRVMFLMLLFITGCVAEAATSPDRRPKVTPGQAIPREPIDKNDVAMVRHYLKRGANIDAPSAANASPLMIAIAMRSRGVTDLLLESGADVNVAAPSGETALTNAVILNELKLGKRLIKAGAKVKGTEQGAHALGIAAHMGYDDWVEFLLKSGVDVNQPDRAGQTALHKAAGRKQVKTVQLLLKKRAKVDPDTKYYRAPLHEAARAGSVEVIKLLLAKGAKIDRVSRHYRESALMIAVQGRRTEAVKLLVRKGANKKLEDDEGHTALHHAERTGDKTLIRLVN